MCIKTSLTPSFGRVTAQVGRRPLRCGFWMRRSALASSHFCGWRFSSHCRCDPKLFVRTSTTFRRMVLAFHEAFANLQERAAEHMFERKIPFEPYVTGWDKLGRMKCIARSNCWEESGQTWVQYPERCACSTDDGALVSVVISPKVVRTLGEGQFPTRVAHKPTLVFCVRVDDDQHSAYNVREDVCVLHHREGERGASGPSLSSGMRGREERRQDSNKEEGWVLRDRHPGQRRRGWSIAVQRAGAIQATRQRL